MLTTTGVPCSFIESTGAGWRANIDSESIAEALREALEESSPQLAERGARGRDHIRRNYLWATVRDRLNELYWWLLGSRDTPDFIALS